MSYYISGQANEKTYKLNNGHEATFNYNDDGIGFATLEFMDAVFERLNNSVEVVRCKDCKKYNTDDCMMIHGKKMNRNIFANDFCSYGERADT